MLRLLPAAAAHWVPLHGVRGG